MWNYVYSMQSTSLHLGSIGNVPLSTWASVCEMWGKCVAGTFLSHGNLYQEHYDPGWDVCLTSQCVSMYTLKSCTSEEFQHKKMNHHLQFHVSINVLFPPVSRSADEMHTAHWESGGENRGMEPTWLQAQRGGGCSSEVHLCSGQRKRCSAGWCRSKDWEAGCVNACSTKVQNSLFQPLSGLTAISLHYIFCQQKNYRLPPHPLSLMQCSWSGAFDRYVTTTIHIHVTAHKCNHTNTELINTQKYGSYSILYFGCTENRWPLSGHRLSGSRSRRQHAK